MSALENIHLEDLDQEQQEVAVLIGLENYKKLMAEYGGVSIYIPKADRLERMERNDKIRDEFTGYNFRELAVKYGLTEVSIRSIVADKVRQLRARPLDGQMSLGLDGLMECSVFQ